MKDPSELIKTTESVAKAAQSFVDFINRILGQPLEELGAAFIADPLKRYRAENWLNWFPKIKGRMHESHLLSPGGKPLRINIKLLTGIFEEATLESDDDLQDLWAGLLVSALDPDAPVVRSAFITIVKDLSPIDARLLEALYAAVLGVSGGGIAVIPDYADNIRERTGLSDGTYQESADNLRRLGLIDSHKSTVEVEAPKAGEFHAIDFATRDHGYDIVTLTRMGMSFMHACGSQPGVSKPK